MTKKLNFVTVFLNTLGLLVFLITLVVHLPSIWHLFTGILMFVVAGWDAGVIVLINHELENAYEITIKKK